MLANEKIFASDEEYFADQEFISHSQIKDFFTCEYFYECKYITKTFVDEEEHDYFVYGSAVDSLLTEHPDNFLDRFYPLAEGQRKIDTDGKEGIEAAMAELQKDIEIRANEKKATKALESKVATYQAKLEALSVLTGKTQISATVFKHVRQSAEELLRQPLFKMFGVGEPGMSQGIIALTINGIKQKGKLDYLNPDKRIIADVKTCANIEKFNPRIYATQLAHYRRLASTYYETEKEAWDHYLLVVDKQTDVKRSKIFCISKDIINDAEKELDKLLIDFVDRRATGFFTPITEKTDDPEKAREEVCFKCPNYNKCPFSLQKDIDYIY